MALTDAPRVELSAFGRALAERIGKNGPLTLAEYMDLCAAEYYGTRSPFGKEGDFITSPEIGPLFGEIIGDWIADMWLQAGKPKAFRFAELGPGRGVLSANALRVLPPECRAAMTLHLVEISDALRRVQGEALKAYSPNWHDKFDDVPSGPLFLAANEFVTALPIRQYIRHKSKWHEKLVAFDAEAGEFVYVLRDEPSNITLPKGYRQPIDRDVFEVNEAANGVVQAIARRIGAEGGAAIIIDYGFGEPLFGDTIQSFKRHKRVDILRNPGGQDVTANIDFSALADAARPFADVHGPVTQGEFLSRMGIAERTEAFCAATTDAKKRGEARLALRRLTGASDMGEKFRVIALTPKGSNLQPKGFTDGADIPDDRS